MSTTPFFHDNFEDTALFYHDLYNATTPPAVAANPAPAGWTGWGTGGHSNSGFSPSRELRVNYQKMVYNPGPAFANPQSMGVFTSYAMPNGFSVSFRIKSFPAGSYNASKFFFQAYSSNGDTLKIVYLQGNPGSVQVINIIAGAQTTTSLSLSYNTATGTFTDNITVTVAPSLLTIAASSGGSVTQTSGAPFLPSVNAFELGGQHLDVVFPSSVNAPIQAALMMSNLDVQDLSPAPAIFGQTRQSISYQKASGAVGTSQTLSYAGLLALGSTRQTQSWFMDRRVTSQYSVITSGYLGSSYRAVNEMAGGAKSSLALSLGLQDRVKSQFVGSANLASVTSRFVLLAGLNALIKSSYTVTNSMAERIKSEYGVRLDMRSPVKSPYSAVNDLSGKYYAKATLVLRLNLSPASQVNSYGPPVLLVP